MIDGITYFRGAHPDTPHRKLGYKRPMWSNTLATGIVSLAEYQPIVLDQGNTSSCEGHRAAMAIHVATIALGMPLGFFPSPDGVYRDARCVSRRPKNHLLPPLEDDGVMTGDVFTAVGWMGVRGMGADVSGRHSDCDPADVNREPRLDELVSEGNRIITGEQTLDVNTDLPGKVLYHLENKRPIGLDVWVDYNFEQWGHSGNMQPLDECDRHDPNGGWHAILCTEIEVTSAGQVMLSGPNSWGDWGATSLIDNGMGRGHWRATAEWVLKAADAAHVWGYR